MKLKNFIKHTLVDIVKGVKEANEETNRFLLTSQFHERTGESGQKVEFDLSVIVNEQSESDIKGAIQVALVNLGGGFKETESNQNIHKIKFEVFVSEKEQSN